MDVPPSFFSLSLEAQIDECRQQLATMEKTHPGMIASGEISQLLAYRRMAICAAVIESLLELQKIRGKNPDPQSSGVAPAEPRKLWWGSISDFELMEDRALERFKKEMALERERLKQSDQPSKPAVPSSWWGSISDLEQTELRGIELLRKELAQELECRKQSDPASKPEAAQHWWEALPEYEQTEEESSELLKKELEQERKRGQQASSSTAPIELRPSPEAAPDSEQTDGDIVDQFEKRMAQELNRRNQKEEKN